MYRASIIDFSIGIQSLGMSGTALEMVIPKHQHLPYCFPILLDRFLNESAYDSHFMVFG